MHWQIFPFQSQCVIYGKNTIRKHKTVGACSARPLQPLRYCLCLTWNLINAFCSLAPSPSQPPRRRRPRSPRARLRQTSATTTRRAATAAQVMTTTWQVLTSPSWDCNHPPPPHPPNSLLLLLLWRTLDLLKRHHHFPCFTHEHLGMYTDLIGDHYHACTNKSVNQIVFILSIFTNTYLLQRA